MTMRYINEHFVTLKNNSEMMSYMDEVWDMLQNAYKDIGGFLTAKTQGDLIRKSSLWKLVTRPHKGIVAVAVYTSKNGGRKLIAVATNGTREGKDALFSIIKEDIKMMDQRQAWAEVSGAMEHLYNKFGGVVVPSKYVQDILRDKEIIDPEEDGHYSREIMGEKHRKIIYGWIDPEIKQEVDRRLNESYNVIDMRNAENEYIPAEITDKWIKKLFDESGRMISHYYDNLRPLRDKDFMRLKTLQKIYLDALKSSSVSPKIKDYISLELDVIGDLLADNGY